MWQARQADPGRGSARPWCIIGRVGIHGIVCRLNPGNGSVNPGHSLINRGQVEPPPDLVRHESKTCPQICASGGGDTGSQVHVFVLMTHHVAEESGEAWKFRSSIMKIPV